MALECTSHQKSYVGACQLCGKNLCKLCIARIKGVRVWCTGCSVKMDRFPDLRVHEVKEEKLESAQHSDRSWYDIPDTRKKVSERPYTEKFGYFDFASLAKKKL